MCKKLCMWISLSNHKFPQNRHKHLRVERKVAPGAFRQPWRCNMALWCAERDALEQWATGASYPLFQAVGAAVACCARRGLRRWSPAEKMPVETAGGGEATAELHWEGALAGPPSGVVLHVVHLLPGPHLGTRGACGAVVSVHLGAGHHRPWRKVTRLALAEPRCMCLPHKEISSFAFCLLGFFSPSHALSWGASLPAVLWHRAAIKCWKPGSESSSDRLPGAGRPGPKSIVHMRKLGRVPWQVFKALENFTRSFLPFLLFSLPLPQARCKTCAILPINKKGNIVASEHTYTHIHTDNQVCENQQSLCMWGLTLWCFVVLHSDTVFWVSLLSLPDK